MQQTQTNTLNTMKHKQTELINENVNAAIINGY